MKSLDRGYDFLSRSRSRLRTLSRKTSAKHHSITVLMICYMFSMSFTFAGVLHTRHLAVDALLKQLEHWKVNMFD